MTKSKIAQKIPPSRYRYEEKNPTVSARLPKEIRDRLRANLAKQGKSLADALIAIANDLDIKAKAYDEAWQEGHDDGLVEGHCLAESIFKVTYRCSKCGEPIDVESTEEREAAGQLMTRAGWGHIKCHERRRQR